MMNLNEEELKETVSLMSVTEMIGFIKELKNKEAFDLTWILLLGKLLQNNFNKFDVADIVTEFADERIGSQSRDDITTAIAISGGTEDMLVPFLLMARQQYSIRKFGIA